MFYSNIFPIINYFVPIFSLSSHSKFPEWFSYEFKCIIKENKLYHLAFKKFNLSSDYIKFSNLKNRSKKLRDRDYTNYLNNVQNSINNNPKYLLVEIF